MPNNKVNNTLVLSMLYKNLYTLLLLLMTLSAISCRERFPAQGSAEVPSHEIWDQLLQQHITTVGLVRYRAFMEDRDQLEVYLSLLTKHPPNEAEWPEQDQIAYWINLYNAYTVALILQYYPVESIRHIGGLLNIPFVNSAWDIKCIPLADELYDLNAIEHGILRKKFNEPRVHFALNCASYSCPALRNEAYTGQKLAQQLEEQAHLFINDPTKNRITADEVMVSKIFSWYRGDFDLTNDLSEYLNRYAKTKITPGTKIHFMDYDWSLNEGK